MCAYEPNVEKSGNMFGIGDGKAVEIGFTFASVWRNGGLGQSEGRFGAEKGVEDVG